MLAVHCFSADFHCFELCSHFFELVGSLLRACFPLLRACCPLLRASLETCQACVQTTKPGSLQFTSQWLSSPQAGETLTALASVPAGSHWQLLRTLTSMRRSEPRHLYGVMGDGASPARLCTCCKGWTRPTSWPSALAPCLSTKSHNCNPGAISPQVWAAFGFAC